MREIGKQCWAIWRGIRPWQRVSVALAALLCTGIFFYLLTASSRSPFVPLLRNVNLQRYELQELCSLLTERHIPFEVRDEAIWVPQKSAGTILEEITSAKVVGGESKGFELFDTTSTWIKGEKELQVLEMRALKGQLEKELMAYDNIKNASVILDLAPLKSFGGVQIKPKASVILTLRPGARLGASEIQAVASHLAGAVRGLEPGQIAISDTTGKLYQGFQGEVSKERFLEEDLQAKVEGILTKRVGEEHFFATVQGEGSTFSIGIMIDKEAALKQTTALEELRVEIEKQLQTIVKGYGGTLQCQIDFVSFEKKVFTIPLEEKKSALPLLFTLFTILLAVLAIIPLFAARKKKAVSVSKTTVDIKSLAAAMQGVPPAKIAALLTQLERGRAEALAHALSPELQEAVLSHLSQMEREEV